MKTDHHSRWLKKQIVMTAKRGFTPAEQAKWNKVQAREQREHEIGQAWKQLARDDRRSA